MPVSTKRAPEYQLYRTLAANDPATPTAEKGDGAQCFRFKKLHIQIVAAGGANPAVQVWFWSEEVGAFVDQHTSLTFAAKGANVSWETTIDVLGRIVLVGATSGADTGSTKILLSGADEEIEF